MEKSIFDKAQDSIGFFVKMVDGRAMVTEAKKVVFLEVAGDLWVEFQSEDMYDIDVRPDEGGKMGLTMQHLTRHPMRPKNMRINTKHIIYIEELAANSAFADAIVQTRSNLVMARSMSPVPPMSPVLPIPPIGGK